MKFLAIISFIILNLVIWKAQGEPLTLSQALREANGGSLELQKSKSAKEEASWKKLEAYAGFLPTITGQVNYINKQRYVLFDIPGTAFQGVPQITPSSDFVLQARVPLFDGFASTSLLLAGNRMQDAAEQQYDWTKFTLERQVVLQYYKSLAAQILKNVAEQNYKTLEDHMKDVGFSRKAGVSTKYDVLRVDVQVSEAQSEILNSSDEIETNKNKLAELMGKDLENRELTGTLPVLPATLADKTKLEDVSSRSDLAALANKTEANRYQDRAASRYWVPRLDFVGQYQYYNNLTGKTGWGDHSDYRDAYQLGLSLTWNIFDGMSSIGKAGEASEQYFQNQKSLEITRIKAKQDYDFWRRKFKYFSAVYRARASDVEKTTESVRLAREGRRAGVRTNTDLLDAELDLFRARAELVKAQLGSIEALINLELTTGQKLYNFASVQ